MNYLLIFILAISTLTIHAQSVVVNSDGTHSTVHGNVIVNSNGTHSTVHDNVIVNSNGTHSTIHRSGNTTVIVGPTQTPASIIGRSKADSTEFQQPMKQDRKKRPDDKEDGQL
jgi:hypothetical protein